ncbi:MAG: ABC transporter permease [Tissierella sp.]|nr:ABC transporter permease [Tissierella sp.]
MILRTSYFMIKRMLRGYITLAILMLTPLALITVLGMVAGNGLDTSGIPTIGGIAITMILAFQLYGGYNTLVYIGEDLININKWRMHSLPYGVHLHAFSIILAATFFSTLQGFVLILFTQFVYGVDWGNIWLVLLVLLLISILTQLLYFNFAIFSKDFKTADRYCVAYGLISLVLGEVWFQLPDIGILNFMSTYGNPFSLGRNAVYTFITGDNLNRALISMGILLAASIVVGIVSIFTGRRKLA